MTKDNAPPKNNVVELALYRPDKPDPELAAIDAAWLSGDRDGAIDLMEKFLEGPLPRHGGTAPAGKRFDPDKPICK
jgi:hypothetical protein